VTGGCEVTLLEASHRLGGQVKTRWSQGFLIEEGAEGFPAHRETMQTLCQGLSLEDRLIGQQVHRSLRLLNGRLTELAPGEAAALLGITAARDATGEGLATFRSGMGELIDRMGGFLTSYGTVMTRWRATRLGRVGSGWEVAGEAGPPVRADRLILALPVFETEALLSSVIGRVSDLRNLRHFASVTVSLAIPLAAVEHKLDATGFVGGQDSLLRACVFCSSKFQDRAPRGWCLLRLFFRPAPGDLAASDELWVGYARHQISEVLGVRPGVWPAWVSRWPQVFSEHPADFPRRLDHIRDRLAGAGGAIELAGAAAGATGVDGAVRSGRLAADLMLASRTP
jgi:protoporphyrinogen oxidase